MGRITTRFARTLLTLVALGTVLPAATAREALRNAGRQIATTRCAGCHALGPTDLSPHKAALPFREISRKYPLASLAEAFAEGITVGHRDMPEFIMEPAEIDALLAFMESLEPGK